MKVQDPPVHKTKLDSVSVGNEMLEIAKLYWQQILNTFNDVAANYTNWKMERVLPLWRRVFRMPYRCPLCNAQMDVCRVICNKLDYKNESINKKVDLPTFVTRPFRPYNDGLFSDSVPLFGLCHNGHQIIRDKRGCGELQPWVANVEYNYHRGVFTEINHYTKLTA